MRAGDVIQGALVFTGERLAFAVPTFAAIIVALTTLWLSVVVMLNASLARKQRMPAAEAQAGRGESVAAETA